MPIPMKIGSLKGETSIFCFKLAFCFSHEVPTSWRCIFQEFLFAAKVVIMHRRDI